jgi:hypothetical protein
MKPRLGSAGATIKFYDDPPLRLSTATTRRIISPEDFEQILETIKKDIPITHLDLSRSDIDDDQVKKIVSALETNTKLKSLNLSETRISKIGVLALIQLVSKQLNASLTQIDVSSNRVHPAFANKLAHELEFNQICIGLKHRSEDYQQIMHNPLKDMPKNPLMRK